MIFSTKERVMGWDVIYAALFPCARHAWYDVHDLDGHHVDIIVFLSDNDPDIPDVRQRHPEKKCITVSHRQTPRSEGCSFLFLRPMREMNAMTYIIPLTPELSVPSQTQTPRLKKILCLGKSSMDEGIVERLLRKSSSIEVHYIYKDDKYAPKLKHPNFHAHVKVETTDMLRMCRECHFIAIFVMDTTSPYIDAQLPGCLPLAISYRRCLIIPQQMNDHFSLPSEIMVTYDQRQSRDAVATHIIKSVDAFSFEKSAPVIDTVSTHIVDHQRRVCDTLFLPHDIKEQLFLPFEPWKWMTTSLGTPTPTAAPMMKASTSSASPPPIRWWLMWTILAIMLVICVVSAYVLVRRIMSRM
jgi:hypothetical protein